MNARILSLCSGYLGLDMAVESVLDAHTVAVSDIDPGAKRILTHRAPDVPNLGDVKTIHWEDWAGVEIMTAGYPCQPFSHAGKRGGVDDPRHIFPYIADGIRRVGPRLVFLENVRGHLRLGFDVVLGALADIGYDAQWVCVRASDVGACHKRERLFIVATPAHANDRADDWEWARPESWSRVPEGAALKLLPTPRNADAGPRGGTTGYGLRDWTRSISLLPTPRSSDTNGAGEHGDGGLDLRTAAAILSWDQCQEAPQDWGDYEAAMHRHEVAVGRTAPSPTELGPKGGRSLSPRFVEWMMMLPDGHVTDPAIGLSRNEQLKALGNGVAPPQAAAALRFMLARQAVAA